MGYYLVEGLVFGWDWTGHNVNYYFKGYKGCNSSTHKTYRKIVFMKKYCISSFFSIYILNMYESTNVFCRNIIRGAGYIAFELYNDCLYYY